MKKIFTLIVMLVAVLGMKAQDAATTWTIAGEKVLLGAHWDPAAEANDMTTTDGNIFTLVKEHVMLQAGSYEFKACPNHGWDGAIGAGTGNASIAIEADGEYTVTFTLNVADAALSAGAVKTGDYVGGDVKWVVAGGKELMGVHWDGASEENTMTSTDGKTYTLTKTDVALNVETPYQYKFVKDESSWYGVKDGALSKEDGNANFELFVDQPGKYTVTFTLDTEAMTANVTTTKTGDAEFGEKTWTLAGSGLELFGGEKEWDPKNTANDMTKVSEGYYELTKYSVNLEAKDYQFKVCANHGWDECYGDNGENMVLTVETAGTYNVVFTFLSESKNLTAELEAATGINTVKENNANTAVIYNLQGQRVQAGYHGVAIQNGRKFMMK